MHQQTPPQMLTSLKCRVFASSVLICLWASLSQSFLAGLQTPPCDMLAFLQFISIISFRIVVWLSISQLLKISQLGSLCSKIVAWLPPIRILKYRNLAII
ncbi:hypothetical protein Hdeb2414_s0025g00661201 [Helianthus debilis subsp. tardiflorus]